MDIAKRDVTTATPVNNGVESQRTEPCQTESANDDIAETGPRQSGTPVTGQSDFADGFGFSVQPSKELGMINSNGNASHNRLSQQFSEASTTSVELPERNGRVVGSARHNAKRERQTIVSSRLRSTSRRVLTGVAAIVILASGVGFAVLAQSESPVNPPAQPRILSVQTVFVRPVTSYKTAGLYTGTIVARRTSRLGFEFSGKLEAIHADEGDFVTAGSALAELDTEHLETRRRQVVARLAQAAAKLDEMVAGPRVEDIAAARSRVVSIGAQVKLLKIQTARHKKLVVSKATSQDEYEQFAFGLQARKAQLNEAQHILGELLNGTRKERITAQRAAVAELNAAIADIDVDLRKSTLKAPYDGTIARRLVDDGTVVESGQPVFRLVEDQVLEAWIGLPVHTARRLAADSLQRVKIGDRYFEATVAGPFPEVDPATRTRMVVLRLDDSAVASVVHGQVVRLELEETVEASGYWLPVTSLTKGTRGLWTAFVVVETDAKYSTQPDLFRVERRDIEVLHTESDRVLVRGTLNSGDRVIAGGTHRVVPGQLVRLANPSPQGVL